MHTVVAGAVGTSGLLHQVVAGHDAGRVAFRFVGSGPPVELTYGGLGRRAGRLAHALRQVGVGPGRVVALLLERGPDLLVAQLAVSMSGAAWMPLDPRNPPARLAFQVGDAAAPLVLTTSDLAGLAAEVAPGTATWVLDDPTRQACLGGHPETTPDVDVRPDDPAYLMYTSGSTGTPKGVLVSHRSAYTYCQNAVEQLGVTAADVLSQVANPAFDVTIFDTFATLLAGGTIVSAPSAVITDPAALTTLLREEHVTVAYIPPAVLALLDPARLSHGRLRAILCIGAVLGVELANRWSRPGLTLHNGYGPTEATVICTNYVCPGTPLHGTVPIGTALPHHRAYVLNKRLRPVPVGVAGQLYISGAGLAHGYLNRSGLTAERFLPDPYGGQPGERMYATGDLVRWRPDGQLEYLGRTDRQIKLRGQRVELGEIEHVLARHPAVRHCAVILRDDSYLAAYVVPEPGHDDPDPAELREHLARVLPTYMIPTAWIALRELPLNPNGKLDLAGLPAPTPDIKDYVPPRTGTERWLAATWRELLKVERVGADDNFFDLGGTSLHGTQLAARVREHLCVELDLHQLFTEPALADLAARLDESEAAPAQKPIVPVARDGTLPCTPQQEGLWLLQRLGPTSMYHLSFALTLRGGLDVPALERALLTLVARHEALRTRFVEEKGLPRQVVDPPPAAVALPVEPVQAEGVESWVSEWMTRPFDLAAGSLFRAAVARLGPDEHVLVLVVHHIVADGWSLRMLADELSLAYAAERGMRGTALPEVYLQPGDHAVWQRDRLDGGEMERRLAYWREALAGLPTLDLPADRPRPAQPTGAGAAVNRRVPGDTAAAARAYARTHQVSFLAVSHAALLTVLHRYTGQEDLVVGSIFSGRTRPEMERIVGFFANTVVLRTDLSGEPTFAEVVRRCHETVLNAGAAQDVPFGVIVDALQPERVAGRNPLFQISLTLQPADNQADLALGDVSAEPLDAANRSARFDIGIEIMDAPDGMWVSMEYSTELFDADRMERLLDHYVAALANGLADPGAVAEDVDIMSSSERRQVLHAWNAGDTAAIGPEGGV
ncbi:amino acid adenylation domain-containing protein [Sphaerisporangium aureirubrum]|uniref:Amino acid adenylation domain-containing protein n=1 Tax=Sphaerisporangium aureirubrum TaxID=1544736 RepID=A0ABW1NW29_9ACTN